MSDRDAQVGVIGGSDRFAVLRSTDGRHSSGISVQFMCSPVGVTHGALERLMRSLSESHVEVDPAVAEAATRLAEVTNAEAVVLFGSRARGDNRPDSDWDVCVIVPDDVEPGRFTPITLWPIVSDLSVPIQIVPITRTAFDVKSEDINSLSNDIQRDGVVLISCRQKAPTP